ncbi:hypothetical protein SH2C18_38650 [Clostridium sediminicola]|uniref:serine hydrolase n=1 Tax=Clostridium sediminicola TaxID=3114879 RepID=UPI0031F254EF
MKKIKFILVTEALIMFLFLGCIICGCENKEKSISINTKEKNESDIGLKLDEYMKAYNENCSYKYSGTILVAKGDEILLNKGYGMANYKENVPNNSNSVFAIGSITKSFTAVGIMQLQEKGLLNVDDPISKYIEGHKRGDDITIHHLLTHTSGIKREGMFLGREEVPLDRNIDYINKNSLLFEPGEDYSYSNAGYNILAAIIEKVSGKSYNDYIRDNILIPLEMNTSRCGIDDSYVDNQSIGYEILTNDPKILSIYNFSCITGGGNIYSTVEDLYKYDRALYPEKLLNKESLEKIFTPHWGDCSYGYGYGWEITERFRHRKINHGGCIGGGGYNSMIIRYPDDDYVLIFLTNNSDHTALYAVFDSMEAIIFEEDYIMPEKIKTVDVNSEILKEYAGEYEFGEGFIVTVTFNNGKLYSDADDGNIYELFPITEKDFYYENHECTRDEFIMDKNNNVVGLKISNNTRVFEGKKIKE